MYLPLVANAIISICAYVLTKRMIPRLKDMFLNANVYGVDMNKADKPKVYVPAQQILLIRNCNSCIFAGQRHLA
jgi:hypothetical protein